MLFLTYKNYWLITKSMFSILSMRLAAGFKWFYIVVSFVLMQHLEKLTFHLLDIKLDISNPLNALLLSNFLSVLCTKWGKYGSLWKLRVKVFLKATALQIYAKNYFCSELKKKKCTFIQGLKKQKEKNMFKMGFENLTYKVMNNPKWDAMTAFILTWSSLRT